MSGGGFFLLLFHLDHSFLHWKRPICLLDHAHTCARHRKLAAYEVSRGLVQSRKEPMTGSRRGRIDAGISHHSRQGESLRQSLPSKISILYLKARDSFNATLCQIVLEMSTKSTTLYSPSTLPSGLPNSISSDINILTKVSSFSYVIYCLADVYCYHCASVEE